MVLIWWLIICLWSYVFYISMNKPVMIYAILVLRFIYNFRNYNKTIMEIIIYGI